MSQTVPAIKLAHVSLLVANVERSRAFYEGVLGLTPSRRRPDFTFGGVWYEFGPIELHLIEVENVPAASADPYGGRDRHVAFTVAELGALIKLLDDNGIEYRRSASGRRALFCRDPDGNALEFNEERPGDL